MYLIPRHKLGIRILQYPIIEMIVKLCTGVNRYIVKIMSNALIPEPRRSKKVEPIGFLSDLQ